MSLSTLRKHHFNDYILFHRLHKNLFSQFSIRRHLGCFLVFMMINEAVVNIPAQEIFIWVSDNFRRRNSRKGNYSVSDLLRGTSLLTDACEVSGSCPPPPPTSPHPLWVAFAASEAKIGRSLVMPGSNAKAAPAASPRYLPEPTPCETELPPAGSIS